MIEALLYLSGLGSLTVAASLFVKACMQKSPEDAMGWLEVAAFWMLAGGLILK